MVGDNVDVSESSTRTNKRLFGWDHYRSYDDNLSAGNEYQTWRDNKRPRRHPEPSITSNSYKITIHRPISPICEEPSNKHNLMRWSSIPPLSSSDVSFSTTASTSLDLNVSNNLTNNQPSSLVPLINDITNELAATMM